MTIQKETIILRWVIFSLILFFTLTLTLQVKAAQPSDQAGLLHGTIAETMDAAGYTYIKLATENGDVWVAIPETPVNKGAEVTCFEGMEMNNFHSNTLDRTFETIIFSPGLTEESMKVTSAAKKSVSENTDEDPFAAAVKAEQQTAGHPPIQEQVSGGSTGAVAPYAEITLEKAAGDNSYTVGELHAKAAELNGKTIRVQGKVVKSNPNIMGRNWLHIQDGSGNPMQNTHDLVITTKEEIETSSVITIEGTLAADKDFGAGYRYDVIIENGVIIK